MEISIPVVFVFLGSDSHVMSRLITLNSTLCKSGHLEAATQLQDCQSVVFYLQMLCSATILIIYDYLSSPDTGLASYVNMCVCTVFLITPTFYFCICLRIAFSFTQRLAFGRTCAYSSCILSFCKSVRFTCRRRTFLRR